MMLEPTTWTMWDYIGLGVMMVLSFVLANAIAWWLESGRQKRIAEKTKILAAESKLRTPVTIVTGFLGSGKTTLINHILTSEEHGKRIVVIENEVGSISIDDKLLRADEQEKAAVGIFVMKNGCMCCTAGSGGGPELERVLNHLIELKDDDDYDYVMIETSGLADPAPVMQTFFSHQTSKGRFFLDGVVSLVDAKHVWMHLGGSSWAARTPEVARQLAHATTVVVNKLDTVTAESGPGSVMALEEEITRINPGAAIVRATHSEVPIGALLDRRAFDAERICRAGRTEEELGSLLAESGEGAGGHGDGHGGHGHYASTRHAAGVASISLVQQDAVHVDRFQQWAIALVADPALTLYRMKGVLNMHGSDKVYVFQGVCGELKGQYHRKWEQDESRISEVVLIGKGLDRARLKQGFDECCVAEAQKDK